MKTIGLLGGMSWESTLTYYRAINEGVKQRLGGLHSAKIVLYSVDFDPMLSSSRNRSRRISISSTAWPNKVPRPLSWGARRSAF